MWISSIAPTVDKWVVTQNSFLIAKRCFYGWFFFFFCSPLLCSSVMSLATLACLELSWQSLQKGTHVFGWRVERSELMLDSGGTTVMVVVVWQSLLESRCWWQGDGLWIEGNLLLQMGYEKNCTIVEGSANMQQSNGSDKICYSTLVTFFSSSIHVFPLFNCWHHCTIFPT
jgi:hypothetical protein